MLFGKYDHKTVLVDSRHYTDRFKHVSRKVNETELASLSGNDNDLNSPPSLDRVAEMAGDLYEDKPIFITCGEKGIVSIDSKGTYHTSGIQLLNKLDTVGAGDTTLSALACCLATGLNTEESAYFANLAAAVTVQKLFITGTANGNEILEISKDPDFIFNPDLAADQSKAYYLPGTNIEICNPDVEDRTKAIKYIVFDQDGTLSLLREGWEVSMKKLMFQAISGNRKLDERISEKILGRVSEYVELSTGVQTIQQMEKLVELVKEFKLVPESDIKDKFGYKSLYLRELMISVNDRLKDIKEGRVDKELYQVKGAGDILRKLKELGIELYLASGTDEKNVIYEAGVLGYADHFEGRIYGSVDDVKKFSKKMVIESIIRDNNLKKFEFGVIGDGPVEIREGKKQSGIAIGVASDEKNGYGLNFNKRTKLIKAGADIIIPDFSEYQALLSFLFPQ